MPTNRLVLICAPDHRFAKKKQVRARDLNGVDMVLFERDTPTRKATDKILKSHGVEVSKVAEFDNIETIKRAVQVGFGVAIVPLPSITEEERSGQLVVVKLAEKDWVRPVGVIYRTDRNLSLAAKKFLQLLESPGIS
jgi:DNA-binding transcriptional LysR family regulator